MSNKQKKKITITINSEILKQLENLTTNKSRFIENLLFNFANENNIKTNDIIL